MSGSADYEQHTAEQYSVHLRLILISFEIQYVFIFIYKIQIVVFWSQPKLRSISVRLYRSFLLSLFLSLSRIDDVLTISKLIKTLIKIERHVRKLHKKLICDAHLKFCTHRTFICCLQELKRRKKPTESIARREEIERD